MSRGGDSFLRLHLPAMHQMPMKLPLVAVRSHGEFLCPLVIRVRIGGYLTSWLDLARASRREHIYPYAGWRVGASNALDAIGCGGPRFVATIR